MQDGSGGENMRVLTLIVSAKASPSLCRLPSFISLAISLTCLKVQVQAPVCFWGKITRTRAQGGHAKC